MYLLCQNGENRYRCIKRTDDLIGMCSAWCMCDLSSPQLQANLRMNTHAS